MTPSTAAYTFLAPPLTIFGWGRRSELPTLASALGRRAFLVVGSRTLEREGVVQDLVDRLAADGVSSLFAARCVREPEVSDVDAVASFLRQNSAGPGDFVLALGGGAALDLGKAAAALATNTSEPSVLNYLEGVGSGAVLTRDPLPVLAMPTTGGTGSEATKNSVVSNRDPAFKKSLRSDRMVPRVVLIDPELAVHAPANVTAWSGLDAITQLIESYITKKASPIPQALCLEGLAKAVPALLPAVRDGHCRWARENLAHAAYLSGLALANSGLGLAHAVAAGLGAVNGTPHGLACAVMLPTALRFNRDAKLGELANLARAVVGPRAFSTEAAAADAVIDAIDSLCLEADVPRRLSALGVERSQLDALVEGSQGNSLNGNPRAVSREELRDLLEALL